MNTVIPTILKTGSGDVSSDKLSAFITTMEAGTKNGSTVAQTESWGILHKTVLTLTACSITLTANGTTSAGGGVKVYDFPEGVISILGATSNLTVANAGGDGSFLAALGSAAAATDGTLTSTEANVCASTAATVSSNVGTCKMKGGIQTTAIDGTATAVDLYLNSCLNADGTGKLTISFTGTITIWWMNLGDN